jgi:hypothetical protein
MVQYSMFRVLESIVEINSLSRLAGAMVNGLWRVDAETLRK